MSQAVALAPRWIPDLANADAPCLMERVANGDAFAFEELYDRYASRVFGVVRRVLRDPAQSEEVTQEVMVEAWQTANRFDPERGRVETWLMTMAHRRAVDRVRSEQAARNRHDKVGARDQMREHDEVAEAVEVNLEHEAVRAAMAVLSDVQRQAVTLAYFEGMTYREVAEALETPLGTIKTRIRDAMIRMRGVLATAA